MNTPKKEPMPSDAGSNVYDEQGRVIGKIAYLRFEKDEWVKGIVPIEAPSPIKEGI